MMYRSPVSAQSLCKSRSGWSFTKANLISNRSRRPFSNSRPSSACKQSFIMRSTWSASNVIGARSWLKTVQSGIPSDARPTMRRYRDAEQRFWATEIGSEKVWAGPHASVARRCPTARKSSRWATDKDRPPIAPIASGCNTSRVPSAASRRRFPWLTSEPEKAATAGDIINLRGFRAAAPPTARPAPWTAFMTQQSCEAYDQRSASLAGTKFVPWSQWYSLKDTDPAW